MPADDYIIQRQIGKGAFGQVYLCEQKGTSEKLVLKKVRLARQCAQERQASVNELHLQSNMRHRNILRYHESWVEAGCIVCQVCELCESGDLHCQVKIRAPRNQLFAEETLEDCAVQVLSALAFLHEHHIVHRDIKCANILVTGDAQMRLADFGLATQLKEEDQYQSDVMVGTPNYMCPDVIQKKRYGVAADIWGLGCVLHELTSLKPAFQALNMEGLVKKVVSSAAAALPASYSESWRSLVRAMLTKDAAKRPTAQQLLAMPCMQAAAARVDARFGPPASFIHMPLQDLPQSIMRLLAQFKNQEEVEAKRVEEAKAKHQAAMEKWGPQLGRKKAVDPVAAKPAAAAPPLKPHQPRVPRNKEAAVHVHMHAPPPACTALQCAPVLHVPPVVRPRPSYVPVSAGAAGRALADKARKVRAPGRVAAHGDHSFDSLEDEAHAPGHSSHPHSAAGASASAGAGVATGTRRVAGMVLPGEPDASGAPVEDGGHSSAASTPRSSISPGSAPVSPQHAGARSSLAQRPSTASERSLHAPRVPSYQPVSLASAAARAQRNSGSTSPGPPGHQASRNALTAHNQDASTVPLSTEGSRAAAPGRSPSHGMSLSREGSRNASSTSLPARRPSSISRVTSHAQTLSRPTSSSPAAAAALAALDRAKQVLLAPAARPGSPALEAGRTGTSPVRPHPLSQGPSNGPALNQGNGHWARTSQVPAPASGAVEPTAAAAAAGAYARQAAHESTGGRMPASINFTPAGGRSPSPLPSAPPDGRVPRVPSRMGGDVLGPAGSISRGAGGDGDCVGDPSTQARAATPERPSSAPPDSPHSGRRLTSDHLPVSVSGISSTCLGSEDGMTGESRRRSSSGRGDGCGAEPPDVFQGACRSAVSLPVALAEYGASR